MMFNKGTAKKDDPFDMAKIFLEKGDKFSVITAYHIFKYLDNIEPDKAVTRYLGLARSRLDNLGLLDSVETKDTENVRSRL